MKIIVVSGDQGSGKTSMVNAFAAERGRWLGQGGVFVTGHLSNRDLIGRSFHTLVVDGVVPTEKQLDIIKSRMHPDGVLVLISNGGAQ